MAAASGPVEPDLLVPIDFSSVEGAATIDAIALAVLRTNVAGTATTDVNTRRKDFCAATDAGSATLDTYTFKMPRIAVAGATIEDVTARLNALAAFCEDAGPVVANSPRAKLAARVMVAGATTLDRTVRPSWRAMVPADTTALVIVRKYAFWFVAAASGPVMDMTARPVLLSNVDGATMADATNLAVLRTKVAGTATMDVRVRRSTCRLVNEAGALTMLVMIRPTARVNAAGATTDDVTVLKNER